MVNQLPIDILSLAYAACLVVATAIASIPIVISTLYAFEFQTQVARTHGP